MQKRFFDFEVTPNWWLCVFGDLPEDYNEVNESIKDNFTIVRSDKGNAREELLKKINETGHEIASHGTKHKEHGKISYEQNLSEIQTCHEIVKNILKNACICFTVFTAIYCIISAIVNVDDTVVSLEVARVLLFFVASVLFSAANGLFKIEKLHSALKIMLHYFLTLAAFYTCMLLPLSLDTPTLIVGIALCSIIYLIIASVYALIRSRYRANKKQNEAYVSQFKKK